MKLTTLLLIIALVQASAASFSQVRLSEKNTSLENIFHALKKQTGYTFFYNRQDIRDIKVSVTLENVTLEQALDKCFSNLPLTYDIKDKTVFVSKKPQGVVEVPKEANAPPIDVTGRVVDESGQPLAGATVIVKNTNNSSITDAQGYFKLKRVDPASIIQVSFIGYEKKEIGAAADLGVIKLLLSTSKLDQVQVVAYGVTSQRLNTGNISIVSAREIAEQPVTNPLLALEGKVPGLYITQTSGVTGGAVNVKIQGQNSLKNGNDPFYVVDGVPYTSQGIGSVGSAATASGVAGLAGQPFGSPFNYLNPSDIESVEVLKDAEATAIYGSRAANGAILINTKKGKIGDTRIDVTVQSGYGRITRKLDVLNSPQYLEMRREAFQNNGQTPSPDPSSDAFAPDLTLWDTKSYTDWQKVLLGNTAHYTNAQGSVSGGNQSIQFLVGAGYNRQDNVFPGQLPDQKASLHFNVSNSSANKKFTIQLSGSYLFDYNQVPSQDLTNMALTLPPDAPALYKADGTINWAPDANGNTSWPDGTNPLAFLLNTYQAKTTNLISNAVLSYQILPGFYIRSTFGYTNQQTNEIATSPITSNPPELRPYLQSQSSFGNFNINSWIIEPQLTYQKTIGKGTLNALVGATATRESRNGSSLTGTNFNSDLNLTDIGSAANFYVSGTMQSIYKYSAVFGRLNYNWNDTYLLELTGRRDGSSRFGAENQFHNFGAVGLGWIFSNESFFPKTLSWLSYGKLKASYGTTGNDQIGDYRFLSLYLPGNNSGLTYQGRGSLQPFGLPNPFLQWELTRKINLGLDLGFIKDRILLGANYFRNRSSNQLLGYNLAAPTGFQSITENFPATIQNSGLELTLNTINIKTANFSWKSAANLTIPHNKLIAFPNLATSGYATQYTIGRPVSEFHVYHLIGVDPATGQFMFENKQGQPTADPQYGVDQTARINLLPQFYGGLSNSFIYKSFQLDVLFSFTKKQGANAAFGVYFPGGFDINQPTTILNRWQKAGDHATIQKYTTDYALLGQSVNAAIGSDADYSDASYIRLKNLSLSWQIPASWNKAAGLKTCRIFVQGQNLLTITSYKGMDPETPAFFGSTGLPPLRILTAGINATF